MFSLVVPIYRNEESIPDLLAALADLNARMDGDFEAVLVVDGSPDRSARMLEEELPTAQFRTQLIRLSRNFGSFAAIRIGLEHARGEHFGVMAADLQEPPELILEFRKRLQSGTCDVVVGTRTGRGDPLSSRLFSSLFWFVYRTIAQREVPRGGVDVFGCTDRFRDHLVALNESNSTLVGLIFWLGFRRQEVEYSRRPRRHGRSAWSFSRKLRYLLDSTFAFSDVPIRLLSGVGLLGMGLAVVLGLVVLWSKISGAIQVPGYTATVLTVMFFGGLNSLGLGLIGEYVWRAFENTKRRPNGIVDVHEEFEGRHT
jgi:glycosyltransferase involved in cell wall biosynthesis